jgi:putative FmdB family regulatory protein
MPIYEYTCKECKRTFPLLQKIGASEKDTICPHCGSRDVKKLISSFSFGSYDPSTGIPSGFTGGT